MRKRGEERKRCCKVKLSYFFTWHPQTCISRKKRIFEQIHHKYTFPSPQHVSPRRGFSYIHDSAASVLSSLHTPVSIWCPPQSSLWNQCVWRKEDEKKWFIHQSGARDTNPSWPADRMVDIAHRSRCRCQTALIRAFGCSVVSRSSSLLLRLSMTAKRKLASARKMHTRHRLIHMSQQIRNCRGSGVRWGPDMPVRAVIILLREEIRLLPQVCLFPRAFCGWVCNIKTFHVADIYIYTHQNFCDCFGPAISKRQRGGRWLSAAVRGAETDT